MDIWNNQFAFMKLDMKMNSKIKYYILVQDPIG